MKARTSFTFGTTLLAAAVCAQLQQICMVVENGFYNLSEAGFVQTADGGYASAGPFSETNDGYNEIGVTKFDANGNLLWMRKWTTGTFDNIFPQALVATADGGLVVAGLDQVTPPQNGWFIVKLDAAGVLQWSKTYASPDFSLIGSFDSEGFIQTNDGGFAMIAFKSSPEDSYCMMRTDANGNLIWSDEIRYTGIPSDVAELPNGDLIFTGWETGGAQLTLRKDGLTGTTEWMHWYNSTTDQMNVYGATVGPDSTIVLVGMCVTPLPGNWEHLCAMALDAQGTPLWMTKVWTSDGVAGYQVTPHPDGGYIITGRVNEGLLSNDPLPPFIVKLDDSGQLEWSKRYPLTTGLTHSIFSRVSIAADGDLLVTGRTSKATSYVQRLLKLAPDGSTCPYCPSQDTGSYVALDPQIAPDQGFMAAGPWAVEAPFTLTMTDHTATVLADACGTMDVEDLNAEAVVSIAPNPFNSTTTVTVDPSRIRGTGWIRIIDMMGRVLHDQQLQGNRTVIERNTMANGSYWYTITDGNGVLSTGTLQVSGR